MTNLRDKTLRGLYWSFTAQFTRQALRFIVAIILARLLTPRDFGLVGMIVVFTGFLGIFSELGFGAALIQKQEIEERHLSSIFWLNIICGIILCGIMLIIAPVVAKFYDEPRLKLLTIVFSINFLIAPFSIVQSSILKRVMDFRKLALIEMATTCIAGGSAVILALFGLGVWSLIWHIILTTLISALLLWQASDWKPRCYFDRNAVKELIGFSGNLFGFNVFNYFVRNSDDLLIGKYMGSAALGVYTRAYSIMLIPINQISAAIGQVMFSSLSKMQDDRLRVKDIYLRTISIIAFITFPMMMGLFVVADSFVLALLGSKWSEVIPILQILCMLALVQSLVTTLGWIYTSQGRTDLFFRWSLWAGALLILSIVVGVWIGTVIAVAGCYAFTSGIILVYPAFAIPGKLINMTFNDVVHSVSNIFICTVLMAGGVWLVKIALPNAWPQWIRLLTLVPFGITLYLVFVHIFRPDAYIQIKRLFWEQLGSYFQKVQSYD